MVCQCQAAASALRSCGAGLPAWITSAPAICGVGTPSAGRRTAGAKHAPLNPMARITTGAVSWEARSFRGFSPPNRQGLWPGGSGTIARSGSCCADGRKKQPAALRFGVHAPGHRPTGLAYEDGNRPYLSGLHRAGVAWGLVIEQVRCDAAHPQQGGVTASAGAGWITESPMHRRE